MTIRKRIKQLASFGVAVLPVSEVENLFLLPDIAIAILKEEKFEGDEAERVLMHYMLK